MWKLNFSEITAKLNPMAQKYKYVLLIFLVGIIMLCLGSPRDAPNKNNNQSNNENTTTTFDLSLETLKDPFSCHDPYLIDVFGVDVIWTLPL